MRFAFASSPPVVACAAPLRPDRFTLFVIGAALLGVALVFAREASYGPGLGADSAIYIEVARNLLSGEFFTQLHGETFILQPPLYPALLAAASVSVFDPKDVIGPLNAALFGATVLLVGTWLRGRLSSRRLAIWSVLAVACSHPLVWAGSIGFPLALFTLLTMLALMNADAFVREGGRRPLALASLFSALAWLTHYTGGAVVVAVFALLAAQPGARLAARSKRAVVYALSSSIPMALWRLIIVQRTEEIFPLQRNVAYALPSLGSDIVTEVSKWAFVNLFVDEILGMSAQWPAASTLGAVALLSLSVGVARGVIRAFLAKDAGRHLWERWGSVFVFGGFALAFLVLYFAAVAPGLTWHGAQNRHLIPAYIPLVVVGVVILDKLIPRIRAKKRTLSVRGYSLPISPSGAIAVALGAWLAWTLALHPAVIAEANRNGIRHHVGHYGIPRYADSEVVQYARDLAEGREIYSNEARALNLFAPRNPPPRWLPFPLSDLPEWTEGAPDSALVLWLHEVEGPFDYDAADLRATPGLEAAADLADGVVFVVSRGRDPRPALRAAYEALTRGEPVVRSVYDLYLDGRTLAYAKSPCSREDGAARFFLHVTPMNADDLPDDRKPHGFDNLDFSFESRGVRFEGKCMVSVDLPSYPIAEIKTGQFAGGERLWEAKIPPGG